MHAIFLEYLIIHARHTSRARIFDLKRLFFAFLVDVRTRFAFKTLSPSQICQKTWKPLFSIEDFPTFRAAQSRKLTIEPLWENTWLYFKTCAKSRSLQLSLSRTARCSLPHTPLCIPSFSVSLPECPHRSWFSIFRAVPGPICQRNLRRLYV